MARRRGRLGSHLVTDDYTGFTVYNTQVQRDYWGNYAVKPLKRNLQEIAMPLNDPAPVEIYRGPNYETFDQCVSEYAPVYVGLTTVPTSQNNQAIQIMDPGIGDMEIGCNFVIR